jgi:nitrogen fixation/metabolism regulation signal transduction histidine kinase
MKNLLKKLNLFTHDTNFQDILFLVVVFVFIAILIIGLFPGKNVMIVKSQEFFIYAVMTVPLVAALYFIVMSLRRYLYAEPTQFRASIRKKIAISLVFVAVLPSLPIVLTSNYLLNQTLSSLVLDKTSSALTQAISMSNEPVEQMKDGIRREMDAMKHQLAGGNLSVDTHEGREYIRSICKIRGITIFIFNFYAGNGMNFIWAVDWAAEDIQKNLMDFYRVSVFEDDSRIDKLSIQRMDFLSGALRHQHFLLVLCRSIPEDIEKRAEFFTQSLSDHKRLSDIINELKSNAGMYLFGLMLFIILVSVLVSLYLAKFITKPVLELSEAAQDVARGNFDVSLYRESEDELGTLFKSFNRMVYELNRNRKIIYQKQRLEAWREMARQVVHEIKNPLTPIRLSAERMRKRFLEDHPDIKKIVLNGSETIIEEVGVLMNILSEFTEFARLPEMKPMKTDLNALIEGCVNFFSSHEHIQFYTDIDGRIPQIYVDKRLMKQTLNNLIQNAIDAVGDSGAIYVISEYIPANGSGHVRITIRDDGTGIKEFDKDKIFNPGFSTKSSGRGHGLAIVQKIIMEHRGDISCKSEFGKGTEFIIDLPIDNKEGLTDG